MSKSKAVDVQPIIDFLGSETPRAWIDCALQNQEILLVDHANCEKKAASTALNLMYRYVEFPQLLQKLSRLAREELRHFEQVHAIMRKRNIDYPQLNASRYAGGLRDKVSKQEPMRLVDILIVGAIIEARSCERFAALAPYLDDELNAFYSSLLKSESRHFMDYLALARQVADDALVAQRTEELLRVENVLIADPDPEFRFHSGVPLAA
ncbi:MAG: tRNA-(ms[2]io[6]A)-hydroxylase [Aequoribacter sp.]|uniref:tRNA-(ms[2]io[6]A)-hydroxylase n=1 Tax=Aequoribacter sp. TaxID=2847771 RepID=UPI003C6808DB